MTDKLTKFIKYLDKKKKSKIKKILNEIKNKDFENKDIKKLKGYKTLFRVRIGKLRIIFEILDNDIEIIDIDYRGNIY